ncbi:hypothetical protein ACFSHR_01495 [Azotobacter chroococcum]
MAYNTGNAIGSNDPRDLFDNAGNLDKLVNGPAQSYPDRLGVSRKSWAGMEADFQAFLLASGYQFLGDYAAALTLTARNQIVRYSGEYYRAAAATELPYTLTGTWATDAPFLVAMGDAVLRQDLSEAAGPPWSARSISPARPVPSPLNSPPCAQTSTHAETPRICGPRTSACGSTSFPSLSSARATA